ncbi:restriction endonuclease subunit S [Streptomyces cellulosae]|nr:restriction endonuclease subunit S [Streptomyces cellulosae]
MSSVLGFALPNSWSSAPLKHVTSTLKRGSAPTYVDAGPVRVISQASNQASGLDWSRARFHNFSGNPKSLKGYLCPNDVLINSTGTGTLGRVGYFTDSPDGLPCMADSHVTIARAKPDQLHARFSYYWLSSSLFQEYTYTALVVGATNQIELNRERLGDAPVPLPPLDEQRRIADFLDAETARIDGLLDARERHIALVKERWEATIYQELIQSRAPEVELRRLGVKVTTGPFGTVFNASQYQEGGVPMVNPLHIRNGSITPDLHHAVPPETAARLARHRLRAGDLVVGRKGDLGRAALVQESQDGWVCGSDCIALHPGGKVLPHFLDYVLRSQYIRSQLLAKSLATTMPSLNEGNLLSLRLPHLTLEQQDAMAERLDRAHDWLVRATNTMRKQLELLRERRQALITAAVTGQFDVTTASGRNITEGVTV